MPLVVMRGGLERHIWEIPIDHIPTMLYVSDDIFSRPGALGNFSDVLF
jgi:hypothetical protein